MHYSMRSPHDTKDDMRFWWFIPLLLLSACSKVYETTLPNGLHLVVREDHRAPVVVSQIWYRVGSVDEPPGLTGISHVLEHMMFKGTERLKPGEFSRIIAENGGRENAFTSRDYTAYFQQLEKSRLAISFELEADRMRNLRLTEAEFQKEIRVVMEERRLRTDDRPEGLAGEKFFATAYPQHPYGHPIIGWMADLERLTVKDLGDWYRRWYVPNNATVIVVGDVKPREVVELAKRYFGPIPAGRIERKAIPPAPPQTEPRRAEVRAPAQVPYFVMGYHVPALTSGAESEPYALSVLAGVLSGGDSARLPQNLVRGQQLVASASADYSGIDRYPTLFTLDAVPARGRNTAEVEAALLKEIERLQRDLVSAEELKRVKAQVMAGEVYGRDSVFNQAMIMGMLETVGLSWRLMDKYVQRIEAVTPEQVRAVARKYLTEGNRTTVNLVPEAISGRKPRPQTEGVQQEHVR